MRSRRKNEGGRSAVVVLGLLLLGIQVTVVAHLILVRQTEAESQVLRRAEREVLEKEIQALRESMQKERAQAASRLHDALTTLHDDLDARFSSTEERLLAPATKVAGAMTRIERAIESEQLVRREEQATVQAALSKLESRIPAERKVPVTTEERFRTIQAAAEPSLFLVHCEFTYLTRIPGQEGMHIAHTGSGFGTAFVVADDGYLVTNKHVVQPWKFDTDLLGLVALGQVEILESSARITAWPSGAESRSGGSNLDFEPAFDNHTARNLALLGISEDSMVSRSVEMAGSDIDFESHDFDNHDLAVIKLEGSSAPPLPLAGAAARKLEPVMALGFPRGQRGIESGRIESSPSLGTIRKVQDTIHITASIIPGNSGGPVFNQEGEVVGVATRIYSETLGICIKSDHIRALLDPLLQKTRPGPEVMAKPR